MGSGILNPSIANITKHMTIKERRRRPLGTGTRGLTAGAMSAKRFCDGSRGGSVALSQSGSAMQSRGAGFVMQCCTVRRRKERMKEWRQLQSSKGEGGSKTKCPARLTGNRLELKSLKVKELKKRIYIYNIYIYIGGRVESSFP